MAVHPAVSNIYNSTGQIYLGEDPNFASQWPSKPQIYSAAFNNNNGAAATVGRNNFHYPQQQQQQYATFPGKPQMLPMPAIPYLGLISQALPTQFYSHNGAPTHQKRDVHQQKPRTLTNRSSSANYSMCYQQRNQQPLFNNQYQNQKPVSTLITQRHPHPQIPLQIPIPLPQQQQQQQQNITIPHNSFAMPVSVPQHMQPICNTTQVQRLAHATIFDIPNSLIDSVISTFKSRLEPLQEMQYKKRQNPSKHDTIHVTTTAHNYTDPQLVYPDMESFVRRFLTDNHIPVMVLVHALIYLDRYTKRLPRRSTACQSAPHLTFLAAILVAAKYCDDLCMMTSRDVSYQFRGLFSIQDVSRIERSFMSIIRYKLYVEAKELDPILKTHQIDKKKLLAATHVTPP